MKNIVVFSLSLLSLNLFADISGTWTNSVGGNWSAVNNWVDGIVPFGKGQFATFNAANVSITNDATLPVGVFDMNQDGINFYGNEIVLDATTPKLILDAGITRFYSPLVVSNGLLCTSDSYYGNYAYFYQRNHIGANTLTLDKGHVRALATKLSPLAGESGVISSVFTTNDVTLSLSKDSKFTLECSSALDAYQKFSSIYIKDKGYLEPENGSLAGRSTITADELTGPGYLRLNGNGAVKLASTARFTGSMINSSPSVKVGGDQPPALLPAAGAIMHLDASDADSFVIQSENGTNFVIRWN